ncbi:hypothetical protein [Desulfopila aestuarii]|uniref:Secreted protein n=1 Tax=Desulfopila aestuarii DSM 18488 TaxID=1121416 RepID=A0A1M7YL21_9BACT|nr:hypothetical protein [Desulfopila aestuarii]SHO53294.1 hypothetical protein SAMN02745220_05047 [Desulfopila aestuarii DSM 18488]
MIRHTSIFASLFVLLFAGTAYAEEYPILDMVADKVIEKYQQATCEQLWQEKAENKGKPKPQKEQELITLLQSNPEMRTVFVDKIAAPVVNKMFECGMVP